MTAGADICLAILAAGQSERFGAEDKLSAELNGKMLGLHVPDALAAFNFKRHIIIANDASHCCAEKWRLSGYDVLLNANAEAGIGTSVACAARAAAEDGASGLLICLADMPFVTVKHIEAMLRQFNASKEVDVVASTDGQHISPPAIFSSAHFGLLSELHEDQGARDLIKTAALITAKPDILVDIDRPELLAQLNAAAD